MQVRILSCRAYPASYLKIGGIYDAEPTQDGNFAVMSDQGCRVLMFLHEIRFVCPAAMRPV